MHVPKVADDVTNDLAALEDLRQQLFRHSLYDSIQTADRLRLFMREHAFAVWDFMSLLKRLQRVVTCCDVPWLPPADPMVCRFINEIVLGEECDEDGRGGYASHYELYLEAMDEVGADARPIRSFVAQLRDGVPIDRAIELAPILPTTRDFVRSTMRLTLTGQPCEVAAAFFYGREDVIPDMFTRLVKSLPQEHVSVDRLVHYLQRHIDLDGNEHGPLARKLVQNLVADDLVRQQAAQSAARRAIQSRIELWNGVLLAIQ